MPSWVTVVVCWIAAFPAWVLVVVFWIAAIPGCVFVVLAVILAVPVCALENVCRNFRCRGCLGRRLGQRLDRNLGNTGFLGCGLDQRLYAYFSNASCHLGACLLSKLSGVNARDGPKNASVGIGFEQAGISYVTV